jgi:hypothetical protein
MRDEISWEIYMQKGGIIKMDIKETGYEGVEWIHLAQDMDQWRILVNMLMNLLVP